MSPAEGESSMAEPTARDLERALLAEVERLRGEVELTAKAMDAANETAKALRNGEPPPMFCAWCFAETTGQDMADHILDCDKRPEARLLAEAERVEAERDAALQRAEAAERAIRVAADVMTLNVEEDGFSISMDPVAAIVLMLALGRDLPSGEAWDEIVQQARALLTKGENDDG